MDFKPKQDKVPLWKRIIAYLIDTLILTGVVFYPLSKKLEIQNSLEFILKNPSQYILITIVIALLTILYWAILEFQIQQSFGKMLMRIKVRSKTKILTFSQCFIRNISKISSLFLIIDTLYMVIKNTNQRYFEKLSNTEVINS